MSGRWRSRYWTADNGEAQQQQQQQQQRWHHSDPSKPGRMRDDDLRGDGYKIGGHNYSEHGGRSSNGDGYDDHNQVNISGERCRYYGRESSQRQFGSHEPHPQRYWRPDEQSEWQRGQSLPLTSHGREPMESLGRNQGSRFIKRDVAAAGSSSRGIDSQANHFRSASSIPKAYQNSAANKVALPASIKPKTQVATKKPVAWNMPQSSLQVSAAKLSSSKQSLPALADHDTSKAKKPFAWSNPDPTPPLTVAETSKLKIETVFSVETLDSNSSQVKNGLEKKKTPWGVHTPAVSCPTIMMQTKRESQPSISKQPLAASSSSALPPLNEHSKQTSSALPCPTPLPPASSWGKRHSNTVSMASDEKKVATSSEEKQKVMLEDFPSLSTVSTMSHRHQGYNNPLPPPLPMAYEVKSTKDKQQRKGKNNSKNGSPHAILASFLPTQEAMTPGKVSKDARPLVSASKMKGTASTSTVGNKRSAPSPATMGSMKDGTGGIYFSAGLMKKGRQRMLATSTPRKKKLTTLKKKILQERLRIWKERNGIVDCDTISNVSKEVDLNVDEEETKNEQPCSKRLKTDCSPPIEVDLMERPQEAKSTTLLVENFIRPDDNLADEDEYDEIISDLIQLAGRVGRVVSAFIPRPQDCVGDEVTNGNGTSVRNDHIGLAFVRFATDNDTSAANQILEGMVVGGHKIRTSILSSAELAQFSIYSKSISEVAPSEEYTRLWRLTVLRVVEATRLSRNRSNDTPSSNISTTNMGVFSLTTVVIHKVLSEDDYEDEEALHESIEDLKGLAAEYGIVVGTRWETIGENKGNVYITYAHRNSADEALKQLNGLNVGGSEIVVSLDADLPQEQRQLSPGEVILSNVLNDDDLEDEDCLNESLSDIRHLAEQYGKIGHVQAEVSGEQSRSVRISYVDGHEIAQQAARQLDGTLFGGRKLYASLSLREIRITDSSSLNDESKCNALPVVLSGGKRIPERFAACKRVPKVPNAGTPRSYASKISDERAVPLLVEMLGELMRLQERSKDDKNARARRRLVMGLREVARGIRAHKVKMVIMANNLDEYGAIDSKLQEILDMATADELPILYELNKRKLGKALGKSIKVSVVGIQNADGAHDQFKKLKKILGMA